MLSLVRNRKSEAFWPVLVCQLGQESDPLAGARAHPHYASHCQSLNHEVACIGSPMVCTKGRLCPPRVCTIWLHTLARVGGVSPLVLGRLLHTAFSRNKGKPSMPLHTRHPLPALAVREAAHYLGTNLGEIGWSGDRWKSPQVAGATPHPGGCISPGGRRAGDRDAERVTTRSLRAVVHRRPTAMGKEGVV
jgi:hypothetical protein